MQPRQPERKRVRPLSQRGLRRPFIDHFQVAQGASGELRDLLGPGHHVHDRILPRLALQLGGVGDLEAQVVEHEVIPACADSSVYDGANVVDVPNRHGQSVADVIPDKLRSLRSVIFLLADSKIARGYVIGRDPAFHERFAHTLGGGCRGGAGARDGVLDNRNTEG